MARARVKKAQAKVKKAAGKVAADVGKKVGRVAKTALKSVAKEVSKKAGPRQRRAVKAVLVKELGALAKKVRVMGEKVLAQGAERAGELARAGLSKAGKRSRKLGGKLGAEISTIKRSALARVTR